MMGDGSSGAIPVGVHDQKEGVEQGVSPLPIGSEPLSAVQADYELERKLFISNIPSGTTLDQLCQEMRFAGPVQKVSLEYRDNQLAGYGFVTFRDNLGVKAALEIFSKKTFNGNLLNLERTVEAPEPPVKDTKNAKVNTKGAKGTRPKPRTSHKFPVPSHKEVSIYDLVRQGPPPPIHGRRFPLPPSAHHTPGEKSSTTVYVGNLGLDVDEERFAAIFATISPVRTWLMRRSSDGALKGFGFVELKTSEDQKSVLSNKASFNYQGRALIMKPAFFSAHTEKDKAPVTTSSAASSTAWPSLNSVVPQETKKSKGFFSTQESLSTTN